MTKQIIRFVTILSLWPSLLPAFSDVNMEDRWHIRDFYNTVFPFGSTASMGWTGNYDSGVAGTVSAEWQEATRVRINFYRAMAGVPADVTFDPVLSAKAQEAALMMSANKTLNHFPPTNWTYYTADGADAAENGNLALGSAGANAIEGYMMDFGSPEFPDSNFEVGHRRWLLYPQTSVMGSGDVPGIENTDIKSANTVYVITDEYFDPRPATREEFVAWPPAGHVPSELVYARWSFALEDADFTNASVDMVRNGQDIPARRETLANFIGDPTLVWVADNMDTTARATWPAPANDEDVTVTVSNVLVGGQNRSYTYTVTIFDAAQAGPDEYPSEPVPLGPVITGHPAYFQTTARPWSEGIDWRLLETEPFNTVLDAENGVQPFEADVSGGYAVIQSTRTASGSGAFHLANPDAKPQILTLPDEMILSSEGATLAFDSSLAYATEVQFAVVEINTGSGDSWQEIWRKDGPVENNNSFEAVAIDLSAYQGKTARFRFRYDLGFGSFFNQTGPNIGWAFDNIRLNGAGRILSIQESGSFEGKTALQASFSSNDTVHLQTRDRAFDGFSLDWGPARSVSPVPASGILSAGVTWAADPVFGYHREVASGWKFVQNLGWSRPMNFPWIHTGSDWLYYVTGSMADGLWLYSPEEGFVFTRVDYDGRYRRSPFGPDDWGDFHP